VLCRVYPVLRNNIFSEAIQAAGENCIMMSLFVLLVKYFMCQMGGLVACRGERFMQDIDWKTQRNIPFART
jgi:hypothetical protein